MRARAGVGIPGISPFHMRTADCEDKYSRKVVYDMWKQASTAMRDGKARGYDLGDKEARTARLVGEGGCVSAEQSGGLSTHCSRQDLSVCPCA